MDLNKKIQNYLNDNGIKQAWLIDEMNKINPKVNMDKNKISSIVLGNRKIMGDEFLVLCMALKINPDYFIDIN